MIEHPDITRTLLTGYPRPCRPACTGCGDEADLYYHMEDEFFCPCCAAVRIEQVVEGMDLTELAELLGFDVVDPSDLTF